jgi:hypothetical protein
MRITEVGFEPGFHADMVKVKGSKQRLILSVFEASIVSE